MQSNRLVKRLKPVLGAPLLLREPFKSIDGLKILTMKAQCRKELKALEKEIAQADKRLKSAEKALRERATATEELTARLNDAQTRKEVSLLSKQG